MKTRKLSLKKIMETNGGSNHAMSSDAVISLGTDSLLSINYEWTQGAKSYKSNIEVGKDINVDFHALNLYKG